ncbi:MAG TPA: endonuclease/exonuclease/phosphatase family protein [Gammaproteobacteria bacterium]|nr:endonuclease/exonuclease/phosphatase family protein [Gammaproteobacteria bacterium]
MKIVSYNIQFGRGLDGEVDLVRICKALRGADIVCLQEVDQWWRRSGDTDQALEIGGLMPTYYHVFGSSFDVDASAHSAHGAVVNRRRRHGNMILSRWPIASLRCLNLPKWHYDDRFNMQMTCLEAVVDTPAMALRIYNCHAGYLVAGERKEQFESLGRAFASAPGEQGAWSGKADIDGDDWSNRRRTPPMPQSAVLCGDLNSTPESAEFARLIEFTGLVDCWTLADPDNRGATTLRKGTSRDVDIAGKIDHILVTPDLAERVAGVEIDQRAEGSDHKPIAAVIDAD